jgi:transposase
VIHPLPNRKQEIPYDTEIYKKRFLVECYFHKLKRFRAVATRYDKTARNFLAAVNLANALIWLSALRL